MTTTSILEYFMNQLVQFTKESPKGSLLSIKELRKRTNLSKNDFDEAALALRNNDIITMHYDDMPYMRSEEDRKQMVKQKGREGDIYYLGIAIRKP